MADYTKTKIYFIQVKDKRYYGHTIQTLPQRLRGHKCDYARHSTRKVYQEMRAVGMTPNDITLEFVEDYPCNDKHEAKEREAHWIRQYGDLNSSIPNRDWRQYRADHIEEVKAYRKINKAKLDQQYKDWKEKNKDKFLAYQKEYRDAPHHKQRKKETDKAYAEAHKDKISEQAKERYLKNRDAILERISQKVPCPHCQKEMRKGNLRRHINTWHSNSDIIA